MKNLNHSLIKMAYIRDVIYIVIDKSLKDIFYFSMKKLNKKLIGLVESFFHKPYEAIF